MYSFPGETDRNCCNLVTSANPCFDLSDITAQERLLDQGFCSIKALRDNALVHPYIRPEAIGIVRLQGDEIDFVLLEIDRATSYENARAGRVTCPSRDRAFQAPEIQRNQSFGTAASIYSLGMVAMYVIDRGLQFNTNIAVYDDTSPEDDKELKEFDKSQDGYDLAEDERLLELRKLEAQQSALLGPLADEVRCMLEEDVDNRMAIYEIAQQRNRGS